MATVNVTVFTARDGVEVVHRLVSERVDAEIVGVRHVAERSVRHEGQLSVRRRAHELRVHRRGVFDFDVVVVAEHAGRRHVERLVQHGGERIRLRDRRSFT